MIEPGQKVEEIKEFAPILRVVDSPLKADPVSFFYDNPAEDNDAAGIAGRLGDDRIKLVAGALSALKAGGLLQTKIEGVMRREYYRFTPAEPMKEALDLFFQKAGTRDYWKEFREYLETVERKKRRTRRLVIILIAVLAAFGLAAVGYLVSGKIKEAYRDRRLEDLSGQTGTRETRYANGQLKSRIEYFSGDRHGLFAAWFENGQKMAEGEYRNNLPQGRWVFWNSSGKQIKVTTYAEGRAVAE
ncbi:MAG: hypothetical protein V1789_11920 [PVC group bacterium]